MKERYSLDRRNFLALTGGAISFTSGCLNYTPQSAKHYQGVEDSRLESKEFDNLIDKNLADADLDELERGEINGILHIVEFQGVHVPDDHLTGFENYFEERLGINLLAGREKDRYSQEYLREKFVTEESRFDIEKLLGLDTSANPIEENEESFYFEEIPPELRESAVQLLVVPEMSEITKLATGKTGHSELDRCVVVANDLENDYWVPDYTLELHEILHSCNLGHSEDKDNIMYPEGDRGMEVTDFQVDKVREQLS